MQRLHKMQRNQELLQAMQQLGLVVRLVLLEQLQVTQPQAQEGQSTLQDRNQDFSDFDPVTLCKYITLIVRAERFYEGYLHNCFENGSVLKIITALTRSQKLINPQ